MFRMWTRMVGKYIGKNHKRNRLSVMLYKNKK